MQRSRSFREQSERIYPPDPQHPRRSNLDLIKENIPAVIIGVILISTGCGLTFWNEGRCVQTTRSLDEGFSAVTKVLSSYEVHSENEGKLVHIWGILSCKPEMKDDIFKVQINAVKMKRRVQVYQWVEEEHYSMSDDSNPDTPRDVSYSYSMTWKDKLVDSSSFNNPWGHENPKAIELVTSIRTSSDVSVGSYQLSPALKETFTDFIPFSGDEDPEDTSTKLHSGIYYITNDLFNPQVGDVRVQFYFAGHEGDVVSIIAEQVGNTLRPHQTNAGPELYIISPGKLDPEQMFSSKHAQNRFLTWSLRMGGWFLIFIGMTSINHILHRLVVHYRWLRDVIAMGIGSAPVTLSMSTSLLIIGGAWCIYRPVLALFIFIVAGLPFIRANLRRRSARQQNTRRT